MVVEVSQDFSYLGKEVSKLKTEDVHESHSDSTVIEKHSWNGPTGTLVISFSRAHNLWVYPSYEWKYIPNTIETGRRKLGRYKYAYCVYKNERVRFTKIFIRNTPDDRIRINIYFVSKFYGGPISEFEKDCESAFTVIY